MLKNLKDGVKVNIHVVTDSLTCEDISDLEKTTLRLDTDVKIKVHEINISMFKNLKWLNGYMAYARLLVPNIVNTSKIIYLDSDLIVNTDISPIWDLNIEGSALGAVSRQEIGETNDKKFFKKKGRDLSDDYFNSGVLLMNIKEWEKQNLVDKCLETAAVHGGKLPSADQTVLNIVFGDEFEPLPTKYNLPVNPDRENVEPCRVEDKVIHLIGYPKPWSLLGEYFNQQAHLYLKVLKKTEIEGYRSYKNISNHGLYMMIRKCRSYAKSDVYMIKNLTK
jgi:lipopolysaccharide biosynthesis glycosyltransferase